MDVVSESSDFLPPKDSMVEIVPDGDEIIWPDDSCVTRPNIGGRWF